MRVLIVDDQAVSRKKVQKIVEGFCRADAVASGQAAIDACRKGWEDKDPYDLITLDVSMPDMDGTLVLQTIRELELENGFSRDQQVKILMVTSSSDKDTVITCIQAGCDDYLVKPLNKEALSAKFEKFGFTVPKETRSEVTERKMVETTIERFNRGDIELPVMPQVVREIQSAMNDAASSIEVIAQLIEKDASISLKLLATANSPMFRGVEKIETVEKAISRIGLKEIHDIITTIANKSLYETKNNEIKQLLKKLWLHSLACGHAAKLISEAVAREFSPRAFLAGLIHDIGSVLLLRSLGEITSAKKKLNIPELLNCVQEVHPLFGAALLEKWEYSDGFVNIAKLHEWPQFDAEMDKGVLVINLADNLVHNSGYGFFIKEEQELTDLDSAKLLKISPDMIDDIIKAVSSQMEESAFSG